MNASTEIHELNTEAHNVCVTLMDQYEIWKAAYLTKENARQALANAEATVEFHEIELRSEQEALRELDGKKPLAERVSVLTAGDAATREKQFTAYLYRLRTEQASASENYTVAWEEAQSIREGLAMAERDMVIADKKISAYRTVADLQAARLLAMSKLAG